ncbi:PAS domain S-box protein [Desulfolucanica intricata]|uniref:PAS domain S-box protein n=1 Tax=Desulfolucanica intricata TaxID=1285191 RepID=UPI00082A78D4|nr:PAS domain S-box protein [Desulfolucanica intricata]
MLDVDKLSCELKNELNELREETKSLKVEIEALREQLTKETAFRKQVEKDMAKELKIKEAIIDLLNKLLLQISSDEISYLILEYAKELTGSKYGYVGYIDQQTGYLVCPTLTKEIWEFCQVKDKDIVFKKHDGLVNWVLNNQKSLLVNDIKNDLRSTGTPPGHIPINRVLCVPACIDGNLVGQIAVANSDRDYTEHDLVLVEQLADIYAIVIQRKWAEEELKKSNDRTISILENITDAFFTLDKEWRFVYINSETERLWERNREELIGKVYWDVFPSINPIFREKYNLSLSQQIPVHFEAFSYSYNKWSEVHVYPSKEGLSIYFRDISDRKRTEEKLRYSEELFSKAFNSSPSMIFIKRFRDWRYIDVNESWLYHLGYQREEVIGRTAIELNLALSPSVGAKIREEIRDQGSTRNMEVKYRTKSGEIRVGLLSTEIVDINNEKCILGVMQDITERKLAEKRLEFERQRLYSLLEGFPGFIVLVAPDYTIRYANRNFRNIYGEPGNRFCYEVVLGEKEPCAICYSNRVLAENQPYNWEYNSPDGKIYRFYEHPFTDIDGSPLILKIIFDVTDQRLAEQEIAKLSRLNLVGEMAAGIGHEIRNPMTTVRGFLQYFKGKEKFSEEKEFFDLMIDELDRANSIITQFLSLAKTKAVDLQLQNLNSILKTLFPLIQADAMVSDKYIKLELEEIPNLLLDEKEIRQLILNLARNGLEAMTSSGILTISTFIDGDEIVLSVRDQGQGIKPEVLAKLGTPFFTTKDTGTGLGMATCYSIANRHNATIDVETDSNGTTFYVRFRGTND